MDTLQLIGIALIAMGLSGIAIGMALITGKLPMSARNAGQDVRRRQKIAGIAVLAIDSLMLVAGITLLALAH
ncbi:MAG: hypothetical protein KA187_02750 [Arenimonas sp.]|nr:hypothetical protein [Arenimonas sp.]MBP6626315.1 hypothetical protein [Arenimonas sp.]